MTFTERIAHRQRWGVWVWIVGFLMVGAVCAALIFVMAVTAPPIYVLCIIVGIIIGAGFYGHFIFSQIFQEHIQDIN